ncbi:MAG: fumarate hydratase [Anaerolineae bacterium]|jgi:fumarate hydratase class I|nr:fumarate hydratase [Anaerolineae bacterium]MBT3711957.1 fumarate hydratase [Anaerolineae bacterium]MBT4310912.1 fumarate hydratase [Anaerolineae bacterium]MBT4457768.1 fumarate hydratase [Anaerolineae bacterium]MBT4843400.1 fumarate hydratase [Anaerolineae bacterium]
MQDLTQEILELIRRTSTDLPADVEAKLRASYADEEPGSAAQGALDTILKNVDLARKNSTPICQDTGTPLFYVHYPEGMSTRKLKKQIQDAVVQSTKKSYLRPNSVNAVTGTNTGDNSGDEHYPTIHFEEVDENLPLTIELMLKGGGCENVGAQYKLPNVKMGAGRDLAGVRKVVLDAVHQAQGKGCAPGVLGVAIGGDRGASYLASKEALLTKIGAENPDPELEAMEKELTEESNQMGIGPMGFGGKTTVLDTKIKGLHRVPASYFVSVSYMCWAYRRRKMTVMDSEVSYD